VVDEVAHAQLPRALPPRVRLAPRAARVHGLRVCVCVCVCVCGQGHGGRRVCMACGNCM
jgi:hypothetical protein